MSVIDEIRERLASLAPLAIDIIDDSHLHAGHAGARSGGGHYRLRLVSDQFQGKSKVARHQMIYSALGELMRTRIHALAINAMTGEEAHTQPTHKDT